MTVIYILLVIAVAFFANMAAQMISHRSLLRGQLVSSIVAGFGVGFGTLSVGIATASRLPETGPSEMFWGHSAAAVIIYLSASFTFLCLVAASETSVRLQILRELRTRAIGLTLPELDKIYSNHALVRRRLKRLLDSGGVILRDNKYHLVSPALLLIANAFRICKMTIYGVTSEFS